MESHIQCLRSYFNSHLQYSGVVAIYENAGFVMSINSAFIRNDISSYAPFTDF